MSIAALSPRFTPTPSEGKSAHPYRALSRSAQAAEQLEAQIRDEISLQQRPSEDGLYLRKNAESFLLTQKDVEAKGTVVLYHGFTAAPWQFREMAADLHKDGFNVYVPRMPGHGMADESGQASDLQMPRTSQQHLWSEFAQKTINDAASLGAPVHAVGLSGGANVALEAGSQNPKVESVTAMAPFLGSNGATGILFPVLSLVDAVTFGLFGKLLDNIPRKPKPASEETPKTQGTWGNALAMYRVGSQVDRVESPLQVITTAKDPLSGTRKVGRLMKRSASKESNGWFHFPPEAKVKHAMVSPVENPNTESVSTIRQVIKDFAGRGKPSNNR